MIGVLIVEDQKMIRDYLERCVASVQEYTLIGSLVSAATAPDFCRHSAVDLVLMDIQTEGHQSGLDATAIIKEISPRTKVLVVTSLLDEDALQKAHQVGADGVWYKDVDERELMDAVARVVNGERIFPDNPPSMKIGLAESVEFTPKEKETLRYVIQGLTYAQISEKMGIDVPGVRWHITNMLHKTGYKTKLQLAVAVQKSKMIVEDF